MTKTVLTEKMAVETVKGLYHSQFAGRSEEWFDYLCEDSVYLGMGEPLLIGEEAIRRCFKAFHGHYVDILQEVYVPLFVTKKGGAGVGLCEKKRSGQHKKTPSQTRRCLFWNLEKRLHALSQ